MKDLSSSVYNRAVIYLQQHYMDARLNRLTVAAALNCSPRQLSRAFEGRSHTLTSAIRLIRLHKGRELLLRKKNWSIKKVAETLHFRNAKHFSTRYKQQFGRTPSEERRLFNENR